MHKKSTLLPAKTSRTAHRSANPDFDRLSRQAVRQADNLPPEAQARVRALLELQFKYAGEYVAYIDRCRTKGKVRQLLPEVFAHSPSLEEVQDAVCELAPQDRSKAVIHYAVNPQQVELPVHYDLPNR
jgi:hypothetical protein